MSRFWAGRKTFVTGATGLLGSWLTEALLQQKAEVTILQRDQVPTSRLLSQGLNHRVNVVRGELEEFHSVERALNEYEIEVVFHLGAQTIVGTADRSPLSTFESNIRGTWTLLEAIRRSVLVERTVVVSSDKAYGRQDKLPYTEEMPLLADHPYDLSKACAEQLARCYHNSYGLPVVVTRCGNLYGPGDLNFSRIIPGTIRSVLRDEAPIIRSDGTFTRDYFYVEDAAEAHLMVAERLPESGVEGEVFNFATERKWTVLEVVEKTLEAMKSNLKPDVLNEAKNEIPHQVLSAEKAGRIFGWKARFDLEEGLGRTIPWYRDEFESGRIR